jgi:predicted ATP-grasp superfamily ATP-dependent carboligase
MNTCNSKLPEIGSPGLSSLAGIEDRTGALVTGADYRGLGILRSLGRHGIPVWVLEKGEQRLAGVSRYAKRSLRCMAEGDAALVEFLVKLAQEHELQGWVLFPTDDDLVGLVARNHDKLSQQFRLTTPPWSEIECVCNKRLLHRLAMELRIEQPRMFCPQSRTELAEIECPFPVIVKPALREGLNKVTAKKAWLAEDRDSLLKYYDLACSLVCPELVLIQEVVPGWGEAQFSYAALCSGGKPVASVVARRTRQFPMDFGRFSTYVESVEESGIVGPAVRLINAIRFTGLIEIEFKRDRRDGGFKLLDVNPRVWGWHTLGERAGVDFSYLLWRLILGDAIPELRGQSGVRWVRMSTDLPTASLEILRGRLTLRDYLRSLRGPIEQAIFALDDPLPGLIEVPLLAGLLAKRLLRAFPWCSRGGV